MKSPNPKTFCALQTKTNLKTVNPQTSTPLHAQTEILQHPIVWHLPEPPVNRDCAGIARARTSSA